MQGGELRFLLISKNMGTLTGTAPNLTYKPAADYNGNDSFTFTVTDGDLTSAPATITLTVAPINNGPVAIQQSRSVDEDEPVVTTLTGTDIEGTALTFAVSAQPAHGSVTMTGAVATYTPVPDFNGTDSFTFAVSDGAATSTPATVSVVVNPVAEFTQWLKSLSLVAGPHDDSDGDGIRNALEFVLGGNPGRASDGAILPTAALISADTDAIPGEEEYLQFTYRRSDRTTVEVEWATSLTGPWTPANGTHGEKFVTEPGDPIDQVKVYIPQSLEANGRLFSRLRVVLDLPPGSVPPPDE